MEWRLALFVFLDFLNLVEVLSLGVLKDSIPAEKLQCFQCETTEHGCLHLDSSSQTAVVYCSLKEPHCKVTREETGGNVTAFSRRCARDCWPGCRRRGALTECTSCCNTSLCNTDGRASAISPPAAVVTGALSLVAARWTNRGL